MGWLSFKKALLEERLRQQQQHKRQEHAALR
jgi:hypothetical protein